MYLVLVGSTALAPRSHVCTTLIFFFFFSLTIMITIIQTKRLYVKFCCKRTNNERIRCLPILLSLSRKYDTSMKRFPSRYLTSRGMKEIMCSIPVELQKETTLFAVVMFAPVEVVGRNEVGIVHPFMVPLFHFSFVYSRVFAAL